MANFFGSWKNLDFRQLRLHWLSVLSSIFATALAVYAVWHPDHLEQDAVLRLLVTVAMGISLFMLPTLIFEAPRDEKRRFITMAALVTMMIIYVAVSRTWSNVFFFYKTLQGFVLCHLLVSLAPYFQRRDQAENEFWSANWFLLNRFQMAGTQSLLLLIGVSLALVSIKHLFGVDIPSEAYGTASAIIIFFVSVMLFIGSLGDRKEIVGPPELLKRLVRTVLTPLALAYFAILYAYTIKVGVLREWPRGGIGFLVSGLAIIVSLGYVIMRPLSTSEEFGSRLKSFWNFSFRLLIVPVLLLMLGLGRRVSEYGWTEQRAALGYLAFWMLGIGIYYWHPNRRRLVGIPLSLTVLLAVTWFGPLSPTFIGQMSQTSRLENLLAKDRATLSFEEKKSINSILRTLCEANGVEVMTAAAKVAVTVVRDKRGTTSRAGYGSTDFARLCEDDYQDGKANPGPLSQALTQLGVPKIDRYVTTETKEDLNFYRPSSDDLLFEKYEVGSFVFNDWRTGGDIAKDPYVEQQHGSLKFRMKQRPASLEWEAAPGVWRNLDLVNVSGFMKSAGDKKLTPDQSSEGLGLTDVYLGRHLEVQVTSARFTEGDLERLNSINFTTLVERSAKRPGPSK